MNADLIVPESIRLYATDPALRTAIHMLRNSKLPPGLEKSELKRYYLADLAARRFVADWGVFALGLWEASWGSVFAAQSTWKLLSAAEVAKESWSVLPSHLWLDDQPFFGWIAVDTKDSYFWTGIVLDHQRGFRIVASTNAGKPDPFGNLSQNSPPFELDENGNWISAPIVHLNGKNLDPEPLAGIAAKVTDILNSWAPTRRVRKSD